MTHQPGHADGGMPSAGTGSTSAIGGYFAQTGIAMGGGYAPTNALAPIYMGLRFPGMDEGVVTNPVYADIAGGMGDPSNLTYNTAKTSDREELLKWLYDRDAEEQRDLLTQLYLAGFGGLSLENIPDAVTDGTMLDLVGAWEQLLSEAETRTALGHEMTPQEIIEQMISFRLKQAGIDYDGDYGSIGFEDLGGLLSGTDYAPESLAGTYTSTSTDRNVNYMDPMDAKFLVRGLLQQELGRDPTQAEYEDFLSAVHAAEARDPSVTTATTTTTLDEEGRVTDSDSSSVTRGGMTEAGYSQLLTQKARSQPGWAEWQAMGTYAPALFSALGATIPGA